MAADQVVRAIEAGGVSCWVAPRDLKPGAPWGAKILEAIEASKIFVLIFSQSSNDSQQALREVEAALLNDVIIIPFRVEDVQPEKKMSYFLASMHWIDAFPQPLEPHLHRLVEAICAHLGIQPKGSEAGQIGQPAEVAPNKAAPGSKGLTTIESITIQKGTAQSTIEFCVGDVTSAGPEDAVDVLVTSAYRDYYFPMPGSVFGSLNKKGLAVEELARHKEVDLRQAFSCWLSKEITNPPQGIQFKRMLCFEPDENENAGEFIGDIFRSIAPFLSGPTPIRKVATTLVAAGSSRRIRPEESLRHLVEAAANWMSSGLPIDYLKIICLPNQNVEALTALFAQLKAQYGAASIEQPSGFSYDFFVSYAHKDSREVQFFLDILSSQNQDLNIFLDKKNLNPGSAWQREIYEAIDDCSKVLTFYSPSYLDSKVCLEEFNIALCRHRESDDPILLPVYLYSASLPTYMKLIQFSDCREFNLNKFPEIAQNFINTLRS
jgi:hypothetical protein